MKQKNYAQEFRKFASEHDCKSNMWFGSNSFEDCEEHEDVVQSIALPLEFVASNLNVSVSVAVETAGAEGPHYIIACNKLVLEDERPSPTDFQWRSNNEFNAWCLQKITCWRKVLAMAKLLKLV